MVLFSGADAGGIGGVGTPWENLSFYGQSEELGQSDDHQEGRLNRGFSDQPEPDALPPDFQEDDVYHGGIFSGAQLNPMSRG